MQDTNTQREFKGIWIPKEIWLNEELSMMERILLAEIDSFETENGCFASNSYLGKIVGLSASRVSGIITKLSSLGYVKSKLIYKPHSREVDKRMLTINKAKIYGIKNA